MSTTASPLAGTFNADPVHSNFAFAVRYQGVSLFKGTLDAVEANMGSGTSYERVRPRAPSAASEGRSVRPRTHETDPEPYAPWTC